MYIDGNKIFTHLTNRSTLFTTYSSNIFPSQPSIDIVRSQMSNPMDDYGAFFQTGSSNECQNSSN